MSNRSRLAAHQVNHHTRRPVRMRPTIERMESRRLLAADLQLDYEQPQAAWYARVNAPAEIGEWSDDFIGPRRFERHDWIVRLSPEETQTLSSMDRASSLLDQANISFQVVAGLGLPGLLHVRTLSLSAVEVETSLTANARVAYFSANDKVAGQLLPNDSDFGNMTSLHNVGQFGATNDADIDAPEAWDTTRGSTSVVVGVIDSGVDATHPDLYLNIWINQGEIPAAKRSAVNDTDSDGLITFYDLNNAANAAEVRDLNRNGYIDAIDLLDDPLWADGRDTDGNGFTDDFFGWNFRTNSNETFAPNNPSDVLGHGTHVSGTIGAIGNNARGVTGVNWRSSIMALKFLDENNQGDTASAIAAVNYASMMRTQFNTNVRVLNNSWGQPGGSNIALKNTIEASGNAGILFVAAAGNGNILGQGVDNDRTSFYPASYDLDNVIAVGASDGTDRLAGFSNYGLRGVDIVAPGVGIRSTLPGGRYGEANGTSMATPHVSGSAALVWSLQPDATVPEIRRALLEQGDLIPAIGSQISTGRRLNANKSLAANVFAPTVQLVSAANITTAGGTEQLITVKYKNRLGVDKASLGNSDIVITRQAALDETLTATLVSSTENANKTEVTAIYRLAAVGGTWDAQDYGNYSITAKSDAARSLSGLASRETTVGSFQVKIAAAGIFYVDTFLDTVDTNPGDGFARDASGRTSLRAAIQEANALSPSPVKIFLQTGTYPLTIAPVIDPAVVFPAPGPGSGYDAPANLQWSNASTGDLDLRGNITLVGLGVNRTTIDAKGIDRVMKVYAGSTVTMTGLTLTGGDAPANHSGGAILTSGNLSLDLVTIKNNQATGGPVSLGGGIAEWNGNLTINRSTIENNTAIAAGGVLVTNQSVTRIDASTFAINVADGVRYGHRYQQGGGGILTSSSGVVEIVNSTFSNNEARGAALGAAIRDTYFHEDGDAFPTQISGNGRYIFMSSLNSLSPTTGNLYRSAYVYDRETDSYETVNVSASGAAANSGSIINNWTSISADGRFVAFTSTANNLVPGDTNGIGDLFVYDRTLGTIKRANIATGGGQANDTSEVSVLSQNGRFVAFHSLADNLVPGDTNGTNDVFIHNLDSGETTLVSVDSKNQSVIADSAYAAVSADGRFVAFQSDGTRFVENDFNGSHDIFVKDRQTGDLERVSVSSNGVEANSYSTLPSISADGRFVAFTSGASNLVAGDTNGKVDVFVHDRETKQTTRVSTDVNGQQSNADSSQAVISGDGQFVVFNSDASNLVSVDTNNLSDFFWVDRTSGIVKRIPFNGPLATFARASISNDGRYVNYSKGERFFEGIGDSSDTRDSYLFDTQTDTLTQTTPSGRSNYGLGKWQAHIAGNSQFIVYTTPESKIVPSDTNNVSDIFFTDQVTGILERVSVGALGQEANGASDSASVDEIGRFVAFRSSASNLVAGDTNSMVDLFLRDRLNKTTIRIATTDKDEAQSPFFPKISSNGKVVVFASGSSRIVSNDTNGKVDVFAYDIESGTTQRVSVGNDNVQSDGGSNFPIVSGDGSIVLFTSTASNLVPGDNSSESNLFSRDLKSLITKRVSSSTKGERGNKPIRADRGVNAAISYDGRYVSFASDSSNLIANDTNEKSDIFLLDRNLNKLSRVSNAPFASDVDGDSTFPCISFDGRYVGYASKATNILVNKQAPLTGVYFFDTLTNTTSFVGVSYPQIASGDFTEYSFGIDNTTLAPAFSGNTVFSFFGARALMTIDLEKDELTTFKRNDAIVKNNIRLTHTTVYVDSIPDGSIVQDLIDGEVVFVNSVVSMPASSVSKSGYIGFRNAGTPLFVNSAFVEPSDFHPLSDNGGPTLTHAMTLDSYGFQSIHSFSGTQVDQRGYVRIGKLDAGAVEIVGSTISGVVYEDSNSDRTQGPQEIGISMAEVFIDINRDGVRNDNEPFAFTSADDLGTPSDNEAGRYRIDSIQPGFMSIVVRKEDLLSEPVRGIDPLSLSQSPVSMDVSDDGKLVVFVSSESNLITNDTNGVGDIFLYDRTDGMIRRVSESSTGEQANGTSEFVKISGDGSLIAFQSSASNLVAGDTNGVRDVFVYDVRTRQTRRASVGGNGAQGNNETLADIAVDFSGNRIAFVSKADNLVPGDVNGVEDIFTKDLVSGLVERLSTVTPSIRVDSVDGTSVMNASFSADFRVVTFVSAANNLVPNDTNGQIDVFVLDRQGGGTTRINLGLNGLQANGASDQPMISGDGRFVTYTSSASNLFVGDRGPDQDLFLYDRLTAGNQHVVTAVSYSLPIYKPSISSDGSKIGLRVFTGGRSQYRVIDVSTGVYETAFSQSGNQSNHSAIKGKLSADGKNVLMNYQSSTFLWESEVTFGPTLRIFDAAENVLDFPVKLKPGNFGGRAFRDSIANQKYDEGEVGLSGQIVFIDEDLNGQLGPAESFRTTDAFGKYSFNGFVSEREYTIVSIPPQGFSQVTPERNASWKIYLSSGSTVTDRDFGFVTSITGGQFENAVLNGKLFNDLNGDGLIQNGEAALVGVTVYLDLNGNEVRDFNEPRAVTDNVGSYSFTGLGNRPYTVRTLLGIGTVQTSPLGTKFATTPYTLTTGSTQLANPQDVIAEDLNGDSWSDLAVALFSGNSVAIRLNDKAGGFGGAPLSVSVAPDGLGPIALASGRLNSGTAVDMISANQLNGTATILLDFNGTGFASKQTLAVGETPTDVVAGKFDADADFDAIVANQSTDQLTLLVNNGSGVFAKGASFSSGGKKPTALVTGLFNNDAFVDIAVANYGTHPQGGDFGNVAVLLGRGDGTFQTAVPYAVGFGPISISTDDFNGDGFADLVTANFLANTASLLLGSANGTFTVAAEQLATGQGPLQVQLQDIEGDGDKDILVTNLLSQTISVLRNRRSQGGSGFEPAENFGVAEFSTAPRLAFAAGDFDKSSTADIAIINSLSDSLKIMRNTLVNGAHRIQLTGVENVANLNFGTRPDVLLPRMDPIDNPESLVEDAPQQTITLNGIALGRTGGPALRITSSSANTAIIPTPTIDYVAGATTGQLKFTPAKDASGQVAITVTTRDAGADKLLDTADDAVLSRVFTVSIKPVNDAPTFDFPASRSITAPEDSAARAVSSFITNITAGGGAYESTQTLSAFLVVADNLGLFSAQPMIDATGTLRFTPAPDAVGIATVTVTLTDNGDSAFGGTNRKLDQFVLTINPVNDAPNITIGGKQTVLVGAPSQSVSGFATGFVPGGGTDENAQIIAGFAISVDKPDLFSVLPTIDSAGTLRYTPSTSRTGMTKVSVQVRDDGGSNNGGVDLSTLKTFDVEVAPLPDTVAPTPVLSSPSSTITNASPIDLTVDFGEVVTGFTLSDLALTNATASNFTDLGSGKFTVALSPTVDGPVTVSVPAATAKDLANNNSLASASFTRTVDRVAPVATITTSEPNPTNKQVFTIAINFGEAVQGFELADLVVGNATASALTETAPGRYSATITAINDGVVFVGFSVGIARDPAGNLNTAPAPLLIAVNSGAATFKPLIITTEALFTGNRSFTATVDFGRVVTGFEVGDLTLTNATATVTDQGAGKYRLNLQAVGEGLVTVGLPANKVLDASNRSNTAADPLTLTYVDVTNSDFGDAPTSAQSGLTTSYPTSLTDNAARHKITSLFLGSRVDADSNGQGSVDALGDDQAGTPDDEEGVRFPLSLIVHPTTATVSTVNVVVSQAAKLDGWIDFNRDGDWLDAGEQILSSLVVAAGSNTLSYTLPAGAASGSSYARFRVSTAGGLSAGGPALDGEVEDYRVDLLPSGASTVLKIQAADVGDHEVTILAGQVVVRRNALTLFSAPLAAVGSVQIVDSSSVLLTELKQPQANLSGALKWIGNRSTWMVSSPALSLSTLVPSSAVGVHTLDLTSTVEQTVQFQLSTIQAINTAKSLRIELGSKDVLQADNNWKYASVAVEGDRFVPRFTQADASLEIRSLSAWQNPLNRLDVNGDAAISPVDALQVINELNNRLLTIGGAFKPPASVPSNAFRFLDTDGNGFASPLDALLIINRLNLRSSGEGESAVTLLADPASLNTQSAASYDSAIAQLAYEDEQRKKKLSKF